MDKETEVAAVLNALNRTGRADAATKEMWVEMLNPFFTDDMSSDSDSEEGQESLVSNSLDLPEPEDDAIPITVDPTAETIQEHSDELVESPEEEWEKATKFRWVSIFLIIRLHMEGVYVGSVVNFGD